MGANLHLGVYLPLRLHFSIAPSVLCGSQGWRKPTPAHPFPEAGADLHLESLLSAAGAHLHLEGVHGPAVWMERLGLRPLYTLFSCFACRAPGPLKNNYGCRTCVNSSRLARMGSFVDAARVALDSSPMGEFISYIFLNRVRIRLYVLRGA